MDTTRTRPCRLAWRTALFAIAFALGGQGSASAEEALELQKFEVTGSRIKRSDVEGSSPVVVVTQQEIERSGATTVKEFVRDVIYNTAGVTDETFTQGFAPASAGIDLRGLGVNRTLVLVNGRRVPVFPFAQDGSASFVDINLIPLGAVDRIEILKDGASSIYGADAIAGVVNIILRQDYEGAEISVQYGGAVEGDGKEGQITVTGGYSAEKGNVTFVVDYFDRDEVMARDRDITESALRSFDNRSPVGDPGTLIRLAGPGRPAPEPDPRCPASNVSEDGFCLYDFAPWNTLIPESQRLGLVASGDYELSSDLTAFFAANYTNSQSERDLAPAPIQPQEIFLVTPDNPNNPFGAPLLSIYRLTELGPRTDEFDTDAWNLLGGVRGYVGNWDWELGVGGGQVNTSIKGTNGYATWRAVQDAIDNGDLNPFGPSPNFNPSSVEVQTRRDGETSLFYADLKATGEIMEMEHGALSAAVGAEFRSEEFSNEIDELTASIDPDTEIGSVVGAFQGTSGKGDRDVWAFFGELNIPALSNLEIDLALRYDDYSDFGGTFNPKMGLRWKPTGNLLLRGSAGTGFKAPSLPELYLGEVGAGEDVFDPLTGEVAEDVATFTEGNPDLDPEESKNFGLGLVWDVTERWDLALDWWRIDVENAVSNNPQFYVDNESRFPDNVERDDGGQIVEISNPYRNIAERKLWGIDFSTNLAWSARGAGDFGLHVAATYLGSFEEQALPDADAVERVGRDGRPRWRGQAALTWSKEAYQAALIVNYVGAYDRVTETTERYEVDSWTTVDASFDWSPTAIRGGTITIGAKNLFDEEPPEEQFWTEGWPWFNRALHNALGRFLYARYKHVF